MRCAATAVAVVVAVGVVVAVVVMAITAVVVVATLRPTRRLLVATAGGRETKKKSFGIDLSIRLQLSAAFVGFTIECFYFVVHY